MIDITIKNRFWVHGYSESGERFYRILDRYRNDYTSDKFDEYPEAREIADAYNDSHLALVRWSLHDSTVTVDLESK